MRGRHYIYLLYLISLLSSCAFSKGEGNEVWVSERENRVKTEFVPLNDPELLVHGFAKLLISGDTLFIYDVRNEDLLFTAFDIKRDSIIGRFGKFGNGPGEIANFGALFLSYDKRKLYGINGNLWCLTSFDLTDTLVPFSPTAKIELRLPEGEGRRPFLFPTMVNDSIAIAMVFSFDHGIKRMFSLIGELNVNSGEIKYLEQEGAIISRQRLMIFDSSANQLIVADGHNDLIQLYNLEAELQKNIYGPDYKKDVSRNNIGFNSLAIGKGAFYAVYIGADIREEKQSNMILEFSPEGNYLRTLEIDAPVLAIAYHEASNRLYLNVDAEPQFGYINLDDYLVNE